MNKYMGWVLYDEPPEGFSIDRHTGSPLSGYDFYTNGRSILNGGIRILVKASGVPVDSMTANHPPARESVPKGKEAQRGPDDQPGGTSKGKRLCPRELQSKVAPGNRV